MAKDKYCQQARNTVRHHSHSQTGRAKDRYCQQAENTLKCHSHSPTEEPRTSIVGRLETQQGTTATHRLESHTQALSVG